MPTGTKVRSGVILLLLHFCSFFTHQTISFCSFKLGLSLPAGRQPLLQKSLLTVTLSSRPLTLRCPVILSYPPSPLTKSSNFQQCCSHTLTLRTGSNRTGFSVFFLCKWYSAAFLLVFLHTTTTFSSWFWFQAFNNSVRKMQPSLEDKGYYVKAEAVTQSRWYYDYCS